MGGGNLWQVPPPLFSYTNPPLWRISLEKGESMQNELTDFKANLFESLMSSGTFEELIQAASDLIHWPLIVIDPTFRILAH